jgi:hypothetical protein
MTYTIFNEDAVKWAKEYDGMPFHALLTDAPYHLTSIVKRFGKNGSAPAKFGTDGVFSRSSKGFMGQTWDGGDVAFQPETWDAFKRVLFPGAFGMAFSASRNWHRMAVAIEDAGFIIHPTIFGWLQGQGFPKATNIQKQLEEDGEVWKGHRYGLQALKPAVEPIIVFQKPYEGKPLNNIVNTGAGALNIDASRIPLTGGDEYTINTFDDGAKPWGNGAGHKYTSRKVEVLSNHSRSAESAKSKGIYGDSSEQETHQTPGQELGRWPANFILSEDVAPLLDAQSGNLKAGTATENSGAMGYHGGRRASTPEIGYKDDGGASRFFFQVQNQIDESDPIFYTAKVSVSERNAGIGEEFEEKKGGADYRPNDDGTNGIQSRLHGATVKGRNPHPTLKPISLAKYLATILLPPVEYAPRRLFVPFSGVASEMIGACLAGWEEVVGIEFDTENNYVELAKKRLEHWIK